MLSKTHKEHNETFPIGYPGRPIVSACNSYTENISGFIDVSSCKRHRCTHCKSINESTEFVCSNTNEAFLLNYDFDCTSENVIYLITCKNVMHNMLVRRTKRLQRE